MEANNISMNNEESLKKINNIYNWRKIRNKYILKQIFEYLNQKIYLKIIKYNKNIKNRIEISHNDYKKYCEIEVEIIPIKDIHYRKNKFINFNNKKEESYYHTYFNDSRKETKRKDKNYINKKMKKIKVIIDYQVKSFEKLFYFCSYIKSINFIKFNRNDINNMESMFCGCSKLEELNLSNLNTKNVTSMSYMFYDCISLKELNLSNFNTLNVSDMSSMFSCCKSLKELDVSNFNTNNVKDMSNMFYNCSLLEELNLSNFNTKNVSDMRFMFYDCQSLKKLNLINFNIYHCANMTKMFFRCLSIEELNISNSFYIESKQYIDTCLPHDTKLKIKI